MAKLLVLSNGAGEDAIARRVLEKLPESILGAVACCPLVGPGSALQQFSLIGPRVLPPSEGLFRESWRLALKDLAQGVIGGHLRQLSYLRQGRSQVRLTVAVGDLFPVIWARLSGHRRILFIGTAKSVFHHPYSVLERWVLKNWVHLSIVRDQATADHLQADGVEAAWFGNAMMDEVQPSGFALPFDLAGPVVTVLPGSRKEASKVLAFQLEALQKVKLQVPSLQVGVAVAPGTPLSDLLYEPLQKGWKSTLKPDRVEVARLERDDLVVELLSGVLGDLLAASAVAVGQAGTANEQAAGAGVPVVAYDSRPLRSLHWYRLRQTGLLGEAVTVVSNTIEAVAEEVYTLLMTSEERDRRGAIGRDRMGPTGGGQRMASAIEQMWQER